MKVVVYSSSKYEKPYIEKANYGVHEIKYIDTYLSKETVELAKGADVVSIFANDDASKEVLIALKKIGVEYLALRSAGYNHVDLKTASEINILVSNVPEYSPYAVAEHTIALMLALNRKLIKANRRIKELNFSLDHLIGFDMHNKTVGIIGTGKIGRITANILLGFGCKVLGYDLIPSDELKAKGITYHDMDYIFTESDIISLHIPLTPHTKYIINKEQITKMKKGVMLINTSRGGLVNTKDVIDYLKTGHIGYLGLDVYEEEKGLFFEDHSEDILEDDIIARLMTFQNVLITSHQGFLTDTALENIAETTFDTINRWSLGLDSKHELTNISLVTN